MRKYLHERSWIVTLSSKQYLSTPKTFSAKLPLPITEDVPSEKEADIAWDAPEVLSVDNKIEIDAEV
jgi:hypothetical protein